MKLSEALLALARSLDAPEKVRDFLIRRQARSLTAEQRLLLRLARRASA